MTGKLLGLCGLAGAGKDHVFGWLRDELGGGFRVRRVAFADEVKLDIELTLGSDVYPPGPAKCPALWVKPYSPEVRRLLQLWGTEVGRVSEPDKWVKLGERRIREHLGAAEVVPVLVVVTDVRFGNEAEMIRRLGGRVAEVVAPPEVRARRLGGQLPPSHPTEEIDFRPDYWIDNSIDGRAPLLPPLVLEYLEVPAWTH